ncbi:MAG: histidine kinase [Betaproteobacteria bacterium]|nr:histidine kinase [Betaproteobacteria bacterium]
MNGTLRARAVGALFGRPRMLNGLSWSAVALVFAFCAFAALEAMFAASPGAAAESFAGLVVGWLVRIPVFMISGFVVLLSAAIVLNAMGTAGGERPWLAVAAALAGCVVGSAVRYVVGATPEVDGARFVIHASIAWFVPAAALTAGYMFFLRTHAAREAAQAAELQRKALEKQRIEARARLLQAQIEPHFLFNTLSNVRRLCQNDAAAGRAMLGQLTRYLRAALPKIRDEESTLADEVELVASYLGVQGMRMGARLQTSIEIPAALMGERVPPLMLATLVENAIKHGVAPSASGGSIRVCATQEADALVLSVSDTGQGFIAASGSGVGLANVRSRLAALYGTAATFQLEANRPQGVVATIRLPRSHRAALP